MLRYDDWTATYNIVDPAKWKELEDEPLEPVVDKIPVVSNKSVMFKAKRSHVVSLEMRHTIDKEHSYN